MNYAAEIIDKNLWKSTQVVKAFPVLDLKQASAFIGAAKRLLVKRGKPQTQPAFRTEKIPRPEEFLLRTPPTVVLSKPINTYDLAQMVEAEEKSSLQTQLFEQRKELNELRAQFNQLAHNSEQELKATIAKRLETFLGGEIRILPENVTVEVTKETPDRNLRGVRIQTKGLEFQLYLGMETDVILGGIFGDRNPWQDLARIKDKIERLKEAVLITETGIKSVEGKQHLISSFFARKALEKSEEGKRLLATVDEMKAKLREYLARYPVSHSEPVGETDEANA